MNDQQNNQTAIEPNPVPAPIVPLAQDYPAAANPTEPVVPIEPTANNVSDASQQDNFKEGTNASTASFEPATTDMPAPSSPAEVTPEMVADFLSKQNNESIEQKTIVQSEPVMAEQPAFAESPKTDPLDMWDEKPKTAEPLPAFVSAEPIIPATTVADKATSDVFRPRPKKGSWIPVIILGLLVVMTAVIVFILLASAQRSTPINQNINSSVSSVESSASTSLASTPDNWIQFTDGLMGVKFSLPPQSSYIEVQTPIKQIPYTAAEIAIYQSKPKEWYYTPTGLIKFGGSNLDAQYISINRAPGRVSGIGSICVDSSLCLVDTAVTFYKVSFNESVDEFIAQVTQAVSSSSVGTTTSRPEPTVSSAPISIASSSASTASADNSQSIKLFGLETKSFNMGDEKYYALKQDNNIFIVNMFAQTVETEALANQIINTFSLSN